MEKRPRPYGHAWHNDGIFSMFMLHFGESSTPLHSFMMT
jgi:hypothetical protein